MSKTKGISLVEHFSSLKDPRFIKKSDHKLIDIMVISICATLCGANTWVEMELFGKAKQDWFETFLDLPNGIPSHDTFGRIFSLLSHKNFQECFLSWINSISGEIKGVVAIDGKTLRRSHDHSSGKAAIHMVSAWSSENNIVLGQIKTEEKSNEITAIPQLLKALDVNGCIVTIDAMGCQTAITSQVIDQGGDYVVALKGNQEKLATEVEQLFTQADETEYEGYEWDYYETRNKSHGREEIRRYWTINCQNLLENAAKWTQLNTIGMVESTRITKQKTTIEHRYYIASIENNATLFGKSARDHWGVENGLHWCLDIGFREDECRTRKGQAAENHALLRHIALNALKREKTAKVGIQAKRHKAGWDEEYLLKVLSGI